MSPKTSKIKIFIILLSAVISIVSIKKTVFREKEIKYRSAQVMKENMAVSIQASGSILPQNRLEIKPTIGGRIDNILVQEGQSVKKGEVIANMSSTERAALIDAATGRGKKELLKWKKLYKSTPIIAPLNGMVIAKNVEPGQTITPSDTIFVMSDRLIVKAQVDETDIAKIKKGQKVSINLDAYPNEIIDGNVDQIAYEAKTVSSVTMYEIEVVPSKVPAFMRSGMTANVNFLVSSKENILVISAEMLHQEDGKPHVFIPNEKAKKKPKSIEVQTGITDGKKVEIISGLNEGDTVLVQEIDLGKKEKKNKGIFSGGK